MIIINTYTKYRDHAELAKEEVNELFKFIAEKFEDPKITEVNYPDIKRLFVNLLKDRRIHLGDIFKYCLADRLRIYPNNENFVISIDPLNEIDGVSCETIYQIFYYGSKTYAVDRFEPMAAGIDCLQKEYESMKSDNFWVTGESSMDEEDYSSKEDQDFNTLMDTIQIIGGGGNGS